MSPPGLRRSAAYTPALPMPLEVYKFGGVAMGTPEAIRAAVGRVAAARAEGRQIACVASAMQGVTDLLLAAGRAAVYVDATDVIVTERRLGGIWPSFPKCARAAHERVRPLLARGQVVVMPGFLGRGPDGELVTLGRGGTDFSAARLARSLDADAVTLWKEVDGLMTADPKSAPGARVLAE